MLILTIKPSEKYDENTSSFIPDGEPVVYRIEHSLASLSKWESEFEIPFLGDAEKTDEQVQSYIKMMSLDGDIDMSLLTQEHFDEINSYIQKKMTATSFTEMSGTNRARPREFITSELIYYWMVSLNIPWECQYWHINRLLTLIKVCNEKNKPEKKRGPMNQSEKASRRALNAQRRAQMGTTG